MIKIKKFNEGLSPLRVDDPVILNYQSGSTNDLEDSVVRFKDFIQNRLQGASKIAANAEEKGGDALLTYHHFQVKLPYYQQAADGDFNPKLAQTHYEDLIRYLYEKTGNNGIQINQIEFQELMGKIEVVGELLIKHQEL